MNSPTPQGDERVTRSGTPRLAGKDKGQTVEELLGTNRGAAKNAEGGRAYLEKQGYVVSGQEYTRAMMSRTLLLLAHGASHPALIAGVRSLALIMKDEAQLSESNEIAKRVETTLEEPMAKLQETLTQINEAASLFGKTALTVKEVMKGVQEECSSVTKQLSDSAGDLVTELSIAVAASTPRPVNKTVQSGTHTNITYATAHLPASHGATLARNEEKHRQVLVDAAPGAGTNGLVSMTELELVEKGKMTLELMGLEAGDAPQGTEFKGARKLKNGGVLFDMNSAAAATWLKSDEVLRCFLAKFGGAFIVKERAHTIVAEYVPTSVKTDEYPQSTFKTIEEANDLQAMAILSAKWIKPPHRRAVGQRTAHLLISFRTIEAANMAIRNGLYIAGKRVSARKLTQEPRRCLKCQSIRGAHLAAECPQTENTCGTCAEPHRTETCQENNNRNYKCVNCRVRGHAAWDRMCPAFLENAARFTAKNPANSYKYFLSTEPHTWELLSNPAEYEAPRETAPNGQRAGAGNQWESRRERPRTQEIRQERQTQEVPEKDRDEGWTQVNKRAEKQRDDVRRMKAWEESVVAGKERNSEDRDASESTESGEIEGEEQAKGRSERSSSEGKTPEPENAPRVSRQLHRAMEATGHAKKLTQTSMRNYVSSNATIAAAVIEATQEEESEREEGDIRTVVEELRQARKELTEIKEAKRRAAVAAREATGQRAGTGQTNINANNTTSTANVTNEDG